MSAAPPVHQNYWESLTPVELLRLLREPSLRKLVLLVAHVQRADFDFVCRFPAECLVHNGYDLAVPLQVAIDSLEACADGANREKLLQFAEVWTQAKEAAVRWQEFGLAAYCLGCERFLRHPEITYPFGVLRGLFALDEIAADYLPHGAGQPTEQALRAARLARRERNVALIREVFGHPLGPVPFDPAWRTGASVAMARQMYESRDFGTMPILADALEDAGCDCEDVLRHCRDENAGHVRGCWVVDLVLGKE